MPNSTLVLAGTVIVLCFAWYAWNKGNHSLPPGPKPLPIVGNIRDFPPNGVPEFQHWIKHRDLYGPISSVSVMGQTLVFLHDKNAAHDLLEKQSRKSSHRPNSEFANMLCGFGELLPCQQYDDNFRLSRKLMHRQLGSRAAVKQFENIQEIESRRCLFRILNEPGALMEHLNTMAGSIILKMTYGYCVGPSKDDPLIGMITRMVSNLSLAAVPLTWLVDLVPLLKFLPDGFPGTSFKETARKWRELNLAAVDVPYSFTRQQMKTGSYISSYVSNLAEKVGGGDPMDEYAIKWTAAAMYAGGTETTAATLSSFILAMMMFPEVQRKAQEEIDRVIGNRRLPGFLDRNQLPYIDGVVKETFRWSPIGSMGVPHVTSEDMVYNGYLIPKGAALLPSIWWFLHDDKVYKHPTAFNPTRYHAPYNEPDPKLEAFGYGRRTCPGQHFADATVFLAVVQILAAFSIDKSTDDSGREQDVKLKVTPGLVTRPVDFSYKIMPRSADYARLIREIEMEHPWEQSHAAMLDKVTVST